MFNKKPVLLYSLELGKIIPHLHKWVNRSKKLEVWEDIAELPGDHWYMLLFKKKYPYAYHCFILNRESMRDWLYRHYQQISGGTDKNRKSQKTLRKREEKMRRKRLINYANHIEKRLKKGKRI